MRRRSWGALRALPAGFAWLVVVACSGVSPAPEDPPPPRLPELTAASLLPTDPVRQAEVPIEPPAPSPAPARHEEVRALWVVRTTLTSPERIRKMVDEADRAGFNTLIVQVRGRGDAYYRSELEPRAEALSGQPVDFDPLATVLAEAKLRGLRVHAWLNIHLVATLGSLPRSPEHLVRRSPELLAVPRELAPRLARMDPHDPAYLQALFRWAQRNSRRVEGLYTSPVSDEIRRHVVRVFEDVISQYEVDGVHFDYVRYPAEDFDYSAGALHAFRAWARPRTSAWKVVQLDRALATDPLAWVDDRPELFAEFRRQRLTQLVAEVGRAVRAREPDLVVSAAVMANQEVAESRHYQPWRAWLREGLLDVAAPMAYTVDDESFRTLVTRAVVAAGDPARVWAGIGSYLTGFEGTVSKIEIARELNTAGVVLFSYDWVSAQRPRRGTLPFLDRLGITSFGRPAPGLTPAR